MRRARSAKVDDQWPIRGTIRGVEYRSTGVGASFRIDSAGDAASRVSSGRAEGGLECQHAKTHRRPRQPGPIAWRSRPPARTRRAIANPNDPILLLHLLANLQNQTLEIAAADPGDPAPAARDLARAAPGQPRAARPPGCASSSAGRRVTSTSSRPAARRWAGSSRSTPP